MLSAVLTLNWALQANLEIILEHKKVLKWYAKGRYQIKQCPDTILSPQFPIRGDITTKFKSKDPNTAKSLEYFSLAPFSQCGLLMQNKSNSTWRCLLGNTRAKIQTSLALGESPEFPSTSSGNP